MSKIKIFTGPVHTGKTTRLFKYISDKQSVDGILSPIVNEKRIIYHISSKTIKEFEVKNSSENTITIGKYIFLNKSFDWANEQIIVGNNSNNEILIIDEIGKLELKSEGLHKSISAVLSNPLIKSELILVVRDYLFEEVISFYNLENRFNLLEIW